MIKDHFELQSAMMDGMLLGGGNDYAGILTSPSLQTSNILHMGMGKEQAQESDAAVKPGKKCCGGTSPSCKGCDNCGPRP